MAFQKGHIPWNKGRRDLKAGPWLGKRLSIEHRKRLSDAHRGKETWNKGLKGVYKHSDETKSKMSLARKGRKGKKPTEETRRRISIAQIGMKRAPFTKEHRRRIANALTGKKLSIKHRESLSISHKGKAPANKGIPRPEMAGEKHPLWKGGYKLANARMHNKRKRRGFALITSNNPFDEPTDYHHIHPLLPYVIPVPRRIHSMFPGNEKSHYNNVNAFMGFRFETEG